MTETRYGIVAGYDGSPGAAQLLVVGARGRDGLVQMSLGSVAQAVLQYAPCPVGVVRQPFIRRGCPSHVAGAA